ncbi:MAG: DNA polymerase III subunit beta [Acidimicrobiia bacterium]
MTLAFRIEQSALRRAAALVGRIAADPNRGGTARVTVAGDKLALRASNGDVTVDTTLAIAEGSDGTVFVPARRLGQLVASLREGAVSATVDGPNLRLVSGPSKATLPTVAEAWLIGPEPVEGEPVDGPALVRALAKVTPAVSREDSRPILNGVLFDPDGDRLTLVATDSYRMAKAVVSCGWAGEGALVPGLALRELVKLGPDGPVMVGRTATAVTFGVGDTTLTCQLIEGEFPKYRAFAELRPPYRLTAVRAELAEAVERVAGIVAGETPVRLDLRPGTLALSAHETDGPDVADEVAVEWDGPELVLGLRPAFLADALAAVESEEVVLDMTDALKPVLVRPVPESDDVAVLMPHRFA